MVTVIIYGVGFQFAWGTIPWIYPAVAWESRFQRRVFAFLLGGLIWTYSCSSSVMALY